MRNWARDFDPLFRTLFFDMVNGGISRMHNRSISNTTLKTDRNDHSWSGFILKSARAHLKDWPFFRAWNEC
jgi:hypothetical protein